MTNENYNKYMEAVNVVCGECYGTEETCKSCPVRKCCDAIIDEHCRNISKMEAKEVWPMTVKDLPRECLIELKQRYLVMLADEGSYAEVMDVDYDEPSQYDLGNADEIVPDDIIFYNFEDVEFVKDDFFCLMETED